MSLVWIPIPSIFVSPFVSQRNPEGAGETMSPLNRFELAGCELIEAHQEAAQKFEKMGWTHFFRSFDGHHAEITKMFAISFEDDRVRIGGFEFVINEDKIAEATKLPQVGECWFKGMIVNKKKCMALLLPLPDKVKLRTGVPVKFLKPEWRVYYEILVRYVTCCGRYSHLHLYHLRLLLAVKGCKLNLPFYLWQSLKKMAQSVRNFTNPDNSLCHHGLIKILLQFQLAARGVSWDKFLADCNLGPTQYWPNSAPRIRRRRKDINSEDNSPDIKEAENVSTPVDNEGNGCADRVSIPCDSREGLDKPEPKENNDNPIKLKEGLVEDENNKSTEYDEQSMNMLNHLAQVCCDREGLGYENLSFSRRITRSMHNLYATPGYKPDPQVSKCTATEPTIVDIEDDILMSTPNTMDIGNSATEQRNDVQSGEVEGNQPELNMNTVDDEPLYNQPPDSPRSPCVHEEDETLQQALGNEHQDKIAEFKGRLKQCLSSTALLEEENKNFRKELLDWIDRWKKANMKKNQYKKSKKSILNTNQLLLERIEKQNVKIIKLKAKLAEARRVVSLHN